MFLSKDRIRQELPKLIENGDEKYVKEVCYDLRVGDEVYRSEEHLPEILSSTDPYVLLQPGQFALVKTFERITVPCNYLGLISIRSTYKFQGLVNVSGFHVDPGYRGHLLFAVQNVGPNDIRLRYGDPAFMIMWAELSPAHLPAEGDPPRPGYSNIPSQLMAQLGGGSITLSELKAEVDRLNTQVKFFAGLAIALIMALLGVILRAVFSGSGSAR